MRYMIGSQLDWAAAPFILLVAVAYVWVADRLLGRRSKTTLVESESKVRKAA